MTIHLGTQFHQKYPTVWEILEIVTGSVGTIRPEADERSVVLCGLPLEVMSHHSALAPSPSASLLPPVGLISQHISGNPWQIPAGPVHRGGYL